MLPIVAWTCVAAAALVLAASVFSIASLARQGGLTPGYLKYRGVIDLFVLLCWVAVLVSGVGLVRGRAWGRTGITVAVAALFVYMALLAVGRLRVLRSLQPEVPIDWPKAVVGHAAVLVIMAVAGGLLLVYLHGPSVDALLR